MEIFRGTAAEDEKIGEKSNIREKILPPDLSCHCSRVLLVDKKLIVDIENDIL
jgi:hypothetical protein